MTRSNERRGLAVSVYRDTSVGDASNGGISATHNQLIVVGLLRYFSLDSRQLPVIEELPARCRVSTPSDDAPAVWLVTGRHNVRDMFLLPAGEDGKPDQTSAYMFGGNLARGHDSRFLRLVGYQYGVRIHDRREADERGSHD